MNLLAMTSNQWQALGALIFFGVSILTLLAFGFFGHDKDDL